MREDAPQRDYPLREVFNGLRYIVRSGASWRMMPNDLPPWEAVYQQTQRWVKAGMFEDMMHTTCAKCCGWQRGGKNSLVRPSSTAARCNLARKAMSGRATTGRNDERAAKRTWPVDTLGYLLALHVTSADQQDQDQVAELAQQVQSATGDSVGVAFVDQGYTGEQVDQTAQAAGIDLIVVRLPEAKRGFVLLPHR